MEKTREHHVEVEPRFTSKRKNCRIKEQDSDSEGVLGGTAASSRHYAEVRVRGKQVEEMHGKDIRLSEELKSQKQKQIQYQKSTDQTLNAKMMDENNVIFKHDTEFHEFRTAVEAGADMQHARMAKKVTELTTTIRESVIINEHESHKVSPNDTILTTTPLESSRKGRM